MKTLRQWLGLCEHKFETIRRFDVLKKGYEHPIYFEYIQECQKCHNIRKYRV